MKDPLAPHDDAHGNRLRRTTDEDLGGDPEAVLHHDYESACGVRGRAYRVRRIGSGGGCMGYGGLGIGEVDAPEHQ